MNSKKFDKIILRNLISVKGADKFGYKNVNDFKYEDYYTKDEFDKFIEDMKNYNIEHHKSYAEGKGNETVSTDDGVKPPKMASVASSSRFAYLALRKGAKHIGVTKNVEFEAECAIKNKPGTQPQMDAYDKDTNTYIEVKCHEIFGDSKKKTLGEAYVNYIFGANEDGIGFKLITVTKPEGEFPIPFKEFGMKEFPRYFDLKQFLCHLLGVACKNHKEEESATLAYLFFKPKTDVEAEANELFGVYNGLQTEIISIFTSPTITRFCEENNIKLKAYYEYAEIMEPLIPANTHCLFA
ncbi:MAG: hypothetical protein IJX10_04025 [Phascolarctobacterium sp.]|nr:hypothetical protein [Phascolarctobacterium sp.]